MSEVDALLGRLVAQFAGPYDFLRELVQNALDAGSDRAEVVLETHTDVGGEADEVVYELRVSDAGGGMDEAGRELGGERVVQAGLSAANAHRELGASPGPGLGDDDGIGQEGPCH